MKLKSFRILNYKSIIDSGECRLSDNDGITVLAGQNESGKSSILQALRDFENGEVDSDSLREDESKPEIICSYAVSEDEFDDDGFLSSLEPPQSVITSIAKLRELTVVKTLKADTTLESSLSDDLYAELKELFELENIEIRRRNALPREVEPATELETEWDVESSIREIVEELLLYTPNVIFFDDFCDLLPDSILVSDVKAKNGNAKGYQAVKNIETILNADFTKLDELRDSRRETTQAGYHETITADFNEKWKQRIGEGTGAKVHVKHNRDEKGTAYLKFYIETKNREFLSVGKRSQGFKWFLSFYLQLKAEDKNKQQLVILFDEPGLYLHSKAQSDMIRVFEELSLENQIIYSTHSPYLIGAGKLHRVRLVLNTKDFGTTIEKITSNKIENQKEAMKPIVDAIGLEVASPFSVAKKDNVILEGISDYHYMNAMKTILDKKYEIAFLPSMGAPNCHLLMEICMGWGLNWVIIFDQKGSTKDYNKIKKQFFNDDLKEVDKKILILDDFDGVEDMFTVGDMKLVDSQALFTADTKNSRTVADFGGKELYARLFHEKVQNGEITKDRMSQTSLRHFGRVFSFIEQAFGI